MPYAQLAALLAALAMVGPFSIDTYLPSFHAIGDELSATPLQVQQTLAAYMFPLAAMTLWHGALSDAWGRKRVILGALAVFGLASLVCAAAGSIESLLAGRALQGISAGAGMVVGRAIVRDRFEGAQAQRLMSHVSMTFALGPAIAPILGGWIFSAFGWRAVFVFLALYGFGLAAACARWLPETHPAAAREPLHLGGLVRNYRRVLGFPPFVLLSLAGGLAFNAFFLYVLSAPAFLIGHLGLDERQFGWLFVPGVSGMLAGSALSARLAGRLSQRRTVALGFAVMIGAAAGNVLLNAFVPPALPWAVLPIMVFNFGLSTAMPSLTLLALDCFPRIRGLAASCQSFLQMGLSGLTAAVVAPALWGSTLGLAAGMALYLSASLALALLGRRAGGAQEQG